MSEMLEWSFWVQTTLGALHFIAALLALGLGPVVLSRKKGDARHVWLGRIWVASMLSVNLSALSMYDISGRPNLFHAFAILSLSALLPGFWAIRKYKKQRQRQFLVLHQHLMIWAYFGLFMAGFWQIVTSLMRISGATEFGMIYNILGVATIALAGVTHVMINRTYPKHKT